MHNIIISKINDKTAKVEKTHNRLKATFLESRKITAVVKLQVIKKVVNTLAKQTTHATTAVE